MSAPHVFPAGTAIAFSKGEYSDYSYVAHAVTMRECSLPDLLQEFKAAHKPKDEWDEPSPGAFVGWMIGNGHLFPADVTEVHLGSYGHLELT